MTYLLKVHIHQTDSYRVLGSAGGMRHVVSPSLHSRFPIMVIVSADHLEGIFDGRGREFLALLPVPVFLNSLALRSPMRRKSQWLYKEIIIYSLTGQSRRARPWGCKGRDPGFWGGSLQVRVKGKITKYTHA